MYGLDSDYLDAMIGALVQANDTMMDTLVAEAVAKSYVPYKGDTLGLDQRPENTIACELRNYDQYATLVTEERGEVSAAFADESLTKVFGARTFYGCDPCDRSNQLRDFLKDFGRHDKRVGDVLRRSDAVAAWETVAASPATITGCNAALTCIRRGLPICAGILNYTTQQITIACSAGVYLMDVPRTNRHRLCCRTIQKQGRVLKFPAVNKRYERRVVTFLGKPERGYPKNFNDIRLVTDDELKRHLHYDQPGGPTRILYLSTLQAEHRPLGLIVANGEKFGEWIHWLPFIRFSSQMDDINARALRIFEVSQEQSQMRDGYMMTPSPTYSIFKQVDDHVIIDYEHLSSFSNPSKYRSTFIVAHASNRWAIGKAEQYGYRELRFE